MDSGANEARLARSRGSGGVHALENGAKFHWHDKLNNFSAASSC